MLDVLDRKIRQMHLALGDLEKSDLSQLKSTVVEDKGGFYRELDFNQGQSDAQLANTAYLLISNIASLKDHLKAWCKKHGTNFEGDKLINGNVDVATIHDLWNIDKHAELNRAPRSGRIPRLENLRQDLKLSTGTSANSSALFMMDPRTGKMISQTTGSAKITLSINADVIDENGDRIGDFAKMCEDATGAWEETLLAAGVPIPPRG